MGMISRRQFETIVERVVKRISEAVPPPNTAKTGNFRYNNAGDALSTDEDELMQNVPAASATVPAPKSKIQQQANAEQNPMITRNPASANKAPSQKQIKVNSVKKALDLMGYTQTPEGQKNTTQNLGTWYDQLDPADALVATADELAKRFSQGG